MARIFGCDIGNKYGFISLMQDTENNPSEMFPSKYQKYDLERIGMETDAFIVPPDGKEIEVFPMAKSARGPARLIHRRSPEQFVRAVKTRLHEKEITVPGIPSGVSPFGIYAAIARDLMILGNEDLALKGQDAVYEMVFAFPVSLCDEEDILNQMQASIEAVTLDGHPLKVAGRLPEPAAVAIDYLYYMQHLAPESIRIHEDSHTVLVYDLGHGTFDTAVVTARSKGDPYQVHIRDRGLPGVGGMNFDDLLYDEICRILKEQYQYIPSNPNQRESIRSSAVDIKHQLTDGQTASCNIQAESGDYMTVMITRERFETLSRGLLNQTLELTQSLLSDASDRGIVVDSIVLSGGASQMPMIKDGLEKLSEGKIPVRLFRPSEAVSYGAARYACGLAVSEGQSDQEKKQTEKSNTVLEQFTNHAWGLWLPSENKAAGEVQYMIMAGEKLPAASQSIRLVSSSDNGMELRLFCSTGEEKEIRTADPLDNKICRERIRAKFLLPAQKRCEVSLLVREDYNVEIICKPEGGQKMEKGTDDPVSVLMGLEEVR